MNIPKLDKLFNRLIIALYTILFLTTPLLWFESNTELFEFPKMVFVYFLTLLVFCFWLGRMVLRRTFLITKTPFDIPLIAFLFSQIFSTIFSIHIITSLFGYYTRLNGSLLSTISYLILFYGLVSNANLKQVKRLIGVLVASLLLVALIAIPEHFGYALSCLLIEADAAKPLLEKFQADCWVQDIQTRNFGTFGQPNWLAAYLISLLPLTWAVLLSSKKSSTVTKLVLISTSVLGVMSLLFTRSRSGILGLVVGAGLLGLFALFNHKQSKKQITTYSILVATLAIPIVVFGSEFTPSLFELIKTKPTPPSIEQTVSNQPDTTGLAVIDRGGTESGAIRKIVWRGAWDVFLNRPIFGSGVETFAYSYYQFRPNEHNLISEWDFLYNKAHNEFLNFLATTGIVGLVSYLSIGIAFTLFVYTHKHQIILPGLLAGYAALAVSNFFGFSTVMVSLVYFLFPAIAFLLVEKKSKQKPPALVTELAVREYLSMFGIFVIFLFSWLYLARFYYADTVFATARKQERSLEFLEAANTYQRALFISPHVLFGPEGKRTYIPLSNQMEQIFNDYADDLSKAAFNAATQEDWQTTIGLSQEAFSASAQTLRLNPRHINFYKKQAGVFLRLTPVDRSLLDVAESILADGLRLAPSDAKLLYNLGLINIDQEATPAAQAYLEEAVRIKANYESARIELAKIYEQEGLLKAAYDQYLYVNTRIAPDNGTVIEALKTLDEQLGDDKN